MDDAYEDYEMSTMEQEADFNTTTLSLQVDTNLEKVDIFCCQ